MIIRIPASKDTYIINDFANNFRSQSWDTNFGASPVLSVYKSLDTTSSSLRGGDSYGRILLQFDTSSYDSVMNYYSLSSSSISCSLHLYNIVHGDTVPTSYYLVAHPMSRSFSEGVGIDMWDYGYCSWLSASSTAIWTNTGSDYIGSVGCSFSFDSGIEDLNGDITSIWNYWINSGSNGLIVKLTDTEEQNDVDYYIKRFYSRHSTDKNKWPWIEIKVPDVMKDRRGYTIIGRSGSIYFYNLYDGNFEDLPLVGSGSMDVTLYDNVNSGSSSFSASFTSSWISTGIYASTIYIPSFTGSQLWDVWSSGGIDYMTGSISVYQHTGSQSAQQQKLLVSIDVDDEYKYDEFVRFNVNIRDYEWELNSFESPWNVVPIRVFDNAFYEIHDYINDWTVISASDYTKLSYDGEGHYFQLPMSSFNINNYYEIVLKIRRNRTYETYHDNNWKFKVV